MRLSIILCIAFIVFAAILPIAVLKLGGEVKGISANDAFAVDYNYINILDYNDFVIRPSNPSDPNDTLISFIYGDGKEVRLIINDANLLEIKYINCTPEEGAKVALWCVEWVGGTLDDMNKRMEKYIKQR